MLFNHWQVSGTHYALRWTSGRKSFSGNRWAFVSELTFLELELNMMTSSNGNIFRVALLAICARNAAVLGEFNAQMPVTRSFDIFFDLPLNRRFSKQSRGLWFETLPCNYDVTVMTNQGEPADRVPPCVTILPVNIVLPMRINKVFHAERSPLNMKIHKVVYIKVPYFILTIHKK